jgi:predicted PurR-regulated permease PerM
MRARRRWPSRVLGLGPMNTPRPPDHEVDTRASSQLLDVLIRAALIGVLAVLCYVVFAPFLTLMAWALILAVSLYPLQRSIARWIGGREGLAATIVVLCGVVLIIAPAALLMNSLGSSIHGFIGAVQQNTLVIPAPRESIKEWPLLGPRIHDVWSKAHTDLPGLVESLQPKIGELARKALSIVANIGVGMLQFLASFVIAGILMAYGEAGGRGSVAIFERIIGRDKGRSFARLSTATIRAVAQGVIGIAFVQALLVGLALLVAGVPWAGVLAAITLVLSVAQVPAVIVILPAIGYIWSSSTYSTGAAIAYTIILLLSGLADNLLKPLMLGRGVDAPMPVVLLGALGGMATAGILGMFLGATLLALGYQIFMGWVAAHPDSTGALPPKDSNDTT